MSSLVPADRPRESALFGMFGGHVNVTDGRYVYMRACLTPDNSPLYDYTLMPMRMASMVSHCDLMAVDLTDPQPWARGLRLLRLPPMRMANPYPMGTLLFDLASDPAQGRPIVDDAVEQRLATLLVQRMRENQAPREQFERLGLPATGPVEPGHLLVGAQHERASRIDTPMPPEEEFTAAMVGVHTPISDLISIPGARAAIESTLGVTLDESTLSRIGRHSPFRAATYGPGVGYSDLLALHRRLGALAAYAG